MSRSDRARFLTNLASRWRWAALAAGVAITIVVVGATLGPVETRPRIAMPVNLERGIAYAAMVAGYVIARPRHWLAILLLAIALAGLLELAQVLTVSRHGTFTDAMIKIAGCGIGVLLGLAGDFVGGRVAVSLRGTTSAGFEALRRDGRARRGRDAAGPMSDQPGAGAPASGVDGFSVRPRTGGG